MGFKSGECGGRYSICTPAKSYMSRVNIYRKHWLLTKAIHKLKDFMSMVYFHVVHHKDTQGSGIGSAIWQLPRELSCGYRGYTKNKLTTLNSRYSRNPIFVIDPSTTVPATIPSKVRSASVEVCLPLTKTCFFSAHWRVGPPSSGGIPTKGGGKADLLLKEEHEKLPN
jgi:hypothetical protein